LAIVQIVVLWADIDASYEHTASIFWVEMSRVRNYIGRLQKTDQLSAREVRPFRVTDLLMYPTIRFVFSES
jgi:hypothetical protein